MTVGELLSRCSSSELTEWGLYFQILAAEASAAGGSGGSQV